jgi:hypothetical protein
VPEPVFEAEPCAPMHRQPRHGASGGRARVRCG